MVYVYSIHLLYLSLQSWSFFLSHCKFYSVFSTERFSWPGLFKAWFIFSDWFLHVSFSRFQYSNLHFGSLLHSFINCLCYWAFICKGFLPLSFAIHLQRTTVHPCIKLFIWFLLYIHKGPRSLYICLFTKDRCPYFPFCLKRTAVLVFCYSFAKDHGPCVVVFILKGPLSLSLLFICNGPLSLSGAIYLQKTIILVKGYSLAKDRRLCLMLFICKGLRYLFCAISLQRKLLFLLSICCPGKIIWPGTLAKHGENAYPSGFVKTAVSQIST